MLQQHETREPVAVIPEIQPLLAGEESLRHDTVQEAIQETLSALVRKDIRAARRGRQVQTALFSVPFLMMVAAPYMNSAMLAPFLWMLLGWGGVFALNNIFLRRRGRRLAALESPGVVGALLDVFKTNGNVQEKSVKEALIRLLPRMKPGDSEGLSREQRQILYLILTQDQKGYGGGWGRDENLKLAALKALEQIGDEEALPVVAQVAQGARSLQVRQAAQECLSFLQTRVEEQQSRQMLLRSSASRILPDETLLRPAAGGAETQEKELLRPAGKETEG